MMNRKHPKLRKLFLFLLFMMSGAAMVSNAILSRRGITEFNISGTTIAASGIMGLLQAMSALICIIMVCVDFKLGRLLATIGQSISLIMMTVTIAVRKEYNSLPGLIFAAVAILSVQVIAKQFVKLEQASITDTLTHLYNRQGFLENVAYRLEKRTLGYIVCIQVKDFRSINENLGHTFGDNAVRITAGRIRTAVGRFGTVCRLDGNVFMVALSPSAKAEAICKKISENVSQRLALVYEGSEVNSYLTAHIGITTFAKDSSDPDTLIKYAYIAMYAATQDKEGNIVPFNVSLESQAQRRDKIQRIIKESLLNDYFYLVYQPQYITKSHNLRGFEALLRCKLPDGTMISPGEFIPVAEKSELIVDIDNYVLKRVLREFVDVIKKSPKEFVVSVNVSARSMSSPDFTVKIKNLLESEGFPPERFEIEITEYSLGESSSVSFTNVTGLREMGVKIALDDFGTGYTSLSQLLKLPVNLLKIDKSLIDNIEQSHLNRDFIDSVIYMGHLMGCEVISEGVESEGQLNMLRDHNCDFIQGYYWGKPLDYQSAVELTK